MLKHFKKGFSGDYRIKMSPGKLRMLWELECPTFGVNWPPEVILDLPTVRGIYQIILGMLGHPDQFHYIDSWLQVAQTMPPWVQFCTNKKGQSRVFMVWVIKSKDQKLTKPLLQGDLEYELPVPPHIFPACPHHQSSQWHISQTSPPPSVSPPQIC
jgi:hypothetical protein